jgi:hypothetical protein
VAAKLTNSSHELAQAHSSLLLYFFLDESKNLALEALMSISLTQHSKFLNAKKVVL